MPYSIAIDSVRDLTTRGARRITAQRGPGYWERLFLNLRARLAEQRPWRRAIQSWRGLVGPEDIGSSDCFSQLLCNLGLDHAAFIARRPEPDVNAAYQQGALSK